MAMYPVSRPKTSIYHEGWVRHMSHAIHFSSDSEFPSSWDLDDARISLASLYGLSSFAYVLAGVLMLTYFSELHFAEAALERLIMLEGACLCVQTLATVQADVVWLGRCA